MQLTSIRKMKCLLVPLELEEFLYHRRKSYLAYKVTCRGKKKITFCWYFLIECFYSIWISWRAESYLHSFFSLLNLSSWEFLMRVRRKHWREIQYCYCFLLQCFGWKWSRSPLMVYERVGVLFVGLFALFGFLFFQHSLWIFFFSWS